MNSRLIDRVFKNHPMDLASDDAMIQTCVIVILAYFTLFQPNSLLKHYNIPFLTLDFSKQNGVRG